MIDQFRRLIYKTRFHLPRSPLSQLLVRSLNPVVAAMVFTRPIGNGRVFVLST